MVGKTSALMVALVCMGLGSGCARTEYQYRNMSYYPTDEMPRKVYIENQVNPLTTNGTLSEQDRVLVEVRTIEGRQERGRLIRISETDIILSTTFFYTAEGDTTAKTENEVLIPKDDVLILKVW